MTPASPVPRDAAAEPADLDPTPHGGPLRGQVLLRQTAMGLCHRDAAARQDSAPNEGPASRRGCSAVGWVETVGDGVGGVRAGDRVGYVQVEAPGAFVAQRLVPTWRLVPIPSGVSDLTAAALLHKGMVAECLLRKVHRIGAGRRVLVHTASGTGLLLCQWLRHLGAYVLGTVADAARAHVAAAHGCHRPIVAAEEDVAGVVRSVTKGRGVDVVYDAVGGGGLGASARCLRARGTLVWYGDSAGTPAGLDLVRIVAAGSTYCTRPRLVDYTRTTTELRRCAAALFTVLQQGVLRLPPVRTMRLADVDAALRQVAARGSSEWIVLLP